MLAQNKSTSQIASIEDMKTFIENYPAFRAARLAPQLIRTRAAFCAHAHMIMPTRPRPPRTHRQSYSCCAEARARTRVHCDDPAVLGGRRKERFRSTWRLCRSCRASWSVRTQRKNAKRCLGSLRARTLTISQCRYHRIASTQSSLSAAVRRKGAWKSDSLFRIRPRSAVENLLAGGARPNGGLGA